MKKAAIAMVGLAVLILFLRGSLQRIDAPVQAAATRIPAGARVDWQLSGSFGHPASQLNPGEDNPWLKQFDNGGFLEMSGLSAGEDEVWVTDAGLSRIQVFSRAGEYLRSIGTGIPIREVKPTDMELFLEDRDVTRTIPRFNDAIGPLFEGKERGLFQATDVCLVEDGWYMLDQLRTGDRKKDYRRAGLLRFGNDGSFASFDIDSSIWPEYLAAQGPNIAFSEPEGNTFYWCYYSETDKNGKPEAEKRVQTVTGPTRYSDILRVRETFFGHKRYAAMLSEAQNISAAAGGYNVIGGMDFGFEKLVVCDSGNGRLQVYNATEHDRTRLKSLVRVIQGVRDDGALRFVMPLDIAIDRQDGQMYVLDRQRLEVAILDEHFNRIGSFGLGDLNSPHAIAISPDGNDIYVSDDRDQCVYHYACADRR